MILLLLVLMDQATTGIYRPRRPERTDLHLAVRENHGLCPHYLREYYLQLFGEKGKPGE